MLLSKFFLPELRPDRVSRRRLLDRFKQAEQCRLVIVSAPAGFGKTTQVSEWVRAEQLRTSWLTLDESDNDPARFWACLVTAVDGLYPGSGKNSRGLLSARPPVQAQVLLTTLLNDLILAAGQYEAETQAGCLPAQRPACLVLDDTHLVHNAAIYEGLLFFIERVPNNLRVVLIGRSDPPLPLGRLRASSRVLEVRAADLRFTYAECEEFLKRALPFSLTPAGVKRLEERTEGWIVGLQLAGLALQRLASQQDVESTESVDEFIDNFSGDNRFILDYLVEEVLNRLSPQIRAFLLQTAVLNRFCSSLCSAVTGLPEGECQAVLERLERDNLFLIPLDTRRQWYRYHHLFADLLRHQLQRQEGELAGAAGSSDLRRRAAGWLAAHGFLPEAIVLALQGQDYEQAAQWIEAYAGDAIERGEYATLNRWVEALPRELLYTLPELLMQYAWSLSYAGEVNGCEQPLSAAEQLWREQGSLARLGEALNLRADLAATYEDGKRAAKLARQALALLPEEDEYHRGMSWVHVGSAAFLQGELDKARQALHAAQRLCERGRNSTWARLAALLLAQVHQAQGRLTEAARLLEEITAQTGGLPVYEGLAARMLLSTVWREWNRLDEAEQALRGVLETVEKTGQAVYFHAGYLNLALILWERGDAAGMNAALDRQARLAEQMHNAAALREGNALRARLAILSGGLQAGQSWVDANRLSAEGPFSPQNEPVYLDLARLYIRQGPDPARAALTLLHKLQEAAWDQRRTASLIEILMLKAQALSVLKDVEGACAALEESLGLACPGGYLRLYLDEGQPLVDLLRAAARRPAFPPDLRAYAARLLNLAPDYPNQPASPAAGQANLALIEPLTPREIEVLGLVQAGHSNREIAEKLYLTLNTVKVHVKNIFAKLAVGSRTQAVRRAEELGLI